MASLREETCNLRKRKNELEDQNAYLDRRARLLEENLRSLLQQDGFSGIHWLVEVIPVFELRCVIIFLTQGFLSRFRKNIHIWKLEYISLYSILYALHTVTPKIFVHSRVIRCKLNFALVLNTWLACTLNQACNCCEAKLIVHYTETIFSNRWMPILSMWTGTVQEAIKSSLPEADVVAASPNEAAVSFSNTADVARHLPFERSSIVETPKVDLEQAAFGTPIRYSVWRKLTTGTQNIVSRVLSYTCITHGAWRHEANFENTAHCPFKWCLHTYVDSSLHQPYVNRKMQIMRVQRGPLHNGPSIAGKVAAGCFHSSGIWLTGPV